MLSPFGGRFFCKNGRKKAVRAVEVRKKAQALPGIERDALRVKKFRTGKRREFGMLAREIVRNGVIFLLQEAAGGVNQPSAVSYQARRTAQDGALLCRELGDRLRAVTPLQIRIAPQRAETAARRIDEHAVKLARETARARAVLPEDQRVHI